ncbi:hypothetical protein BVRB_2g033420 [Beta vulgaris subsp. vulgaris]|uniref:Uncharacterized protein n=1 Tax=Beta vulgaris subsp. vulgaris TaxID=3555 RepID=A0A0J8CWL5_BETVV|nr:hypothetical protein BVRB_2g033420 [Beta vulgaris subsp. vulgaris]
MVVLKFPVLDLDKLTSREYNPGPLRERIFHFSHTSMSKLKAKANQECGTENVISSFQSLSAFVWRSITRVRNLAPDQQTSCFFAIGARDRLDPPISDDYFGSFLYRAQYDCKVKELLDNGIGWNATKLHELIKTQDGKSILQFYEEFAKAPFVVPRGSDPKPLGENGVIMGGSARFDMYGSEFGLGRPLATRMGYANKENGKITASAGCQGGGSVDLEICLRPRIMSALEADQEFMSFVS